MRDEAADELAGEATDELTWRDLAADDVAEVAALTGRCLVAHGGLPLAADEAFAASRYTGAAVATRGVLDRHGRLVASAAVRPVAVPVPGADGAPPRAMATGQVDPAYEGRGLGARLLDWCLRTAAERGAQVTVETESLTDAAERLFTSRGLIQVFGEIVMRFDLAGTEPPPVRPPAGVQLVEWSARHAPRFFKVYDAAFRERPGFPGWSEQQWVDWVTAEGDLRPEWSLLADAGADGDVGFVVFADCWVVQVGVRPDWRGRAVGAALVAEALRRMRADGATEAFLDVNVDNPARLLYPRLGFAVLGRRARFARASA